MVFLSQLVPCNGALLGSQELAVARRSEYAAELPLLGNGKTGYVMHAGHRAGLNRLGGV